MSPDGEELGKGRWTEGDPFSKAGTYTAQFKLSGKQTHQSFRMDLVTKSTVEKLSFEVTGIFAH